MITSQEHFIKDHNFFKLRGMKVSHKEQSQSNVLKEVDNKANIVKDNPKSLRGTKERVLPRYIHECFEYTMTIDHTHTSILLIHSRSCAKFRFYLF